MDEYQAMAEIQEAGRVMDEARKTIEQLRLQLSLEVEVNQKLVYALNALVNDVATKQNSEVAISLANDALSESRNIHPYFINE